MYRINRAIRRWDLWSRGVQNEAKYLLVFEAGPKSCLSQATVGFSGLLSLFGRQSLFRACLHVSPCPHLHISRFWVLLKKAGIRKGTPFAES